MTVDPGSVVPSLDELLAIIDQAEEAAVNAQAAVSMIAGTYAPPYNPGYYMMQNGTLYRSIVFIPATEAFTASHWEATTVSNEIFYQRINTEHHTGAITINRPSGYGYNYADLSVKPGDRFRVTNESDSTVFVQTFDADESEVIEVLSASIPARATIWVMATKQADTIRVYFNLAGTIYIERANSRLSAVESKAVAAEAQAMSSRNLIDFTDSFYGQYYATGTGEHTDDTTYLSLRPIPVEPSTSYNLSTPNGNILFVTLCMLDANMELISGAYTVNGPITTTADTRWLLVSVFSAYLDGLQLEKGTRRTFYEPYRAPYSRSQIRTDLNNAIGAYGRKFCTFGDSLASMDDGDRNAYTWIDRIADRFRGTAYNRGIGASCVTHQKSDGTQRSGHAYVDENGDAGPIRGIYETAPSDRGIYTTEINPYMDQTGRIVTIPADTDIVVIIAGANDIGTVTHEGFRASYTTMLANMLTRVPNAAIYPCTLPFHSIYDINSDETRETYNAFRADIRACAERFGFPVIELKSLMGVNEWNYQDYMNDTVHFNTGAGRQRMAEVIGKFIAEHYARY